MHNDFIIYDQSVESSASVGFLPVIAFRDLIGREPADGEVHTVAFNLAKAPVRTVDTAGGPGAHWSEQPEAFRNLLGTLLDGEFNMVVVDDMIIDFSELIITSVSPTERPGDFNGDGAINNDDLDILLQARNTDAYGPNDPRDLDNNGKIDTRDARLMVLCLRTGACNF